LIWRRQRTGLHRNFSHLGDRTDQFRGAANQRRVSGVEQILVERPEQACRNDDRIVGRRSVLPIIGLVGQRFGELRFFAAKASAAVHRLAQRRTDFCSGAGKGNADGFDLVVDEICPFVDFEMVAWVHFDF
jgi:hypothetical protein